jgi:hypothetical protein
MTRKELIHGGLGLASLGLLSALPRQGLAQNPPKELGVAQTIALIDIDALTLTDQDRAGVMSLLKDRSDSRKLLIGLMDFVVQKNADEGTAAFRKRLGKALSRRQPGRGLAWRVKRMCAEFDRDPQKRTLHLLKEAQSLSLKLIED